MFLWCKYGLTSKMEYLKMREGRSCVNKQGCIRNHEAFWYTLVLFSSIYTSLIDLADLLRWKTSIFHYKLFRHTISKHTLCSIYICLIRAFSSSFSSSFCHTFGSGFRFCGSHACQIIASNPKTVLLICQYDVCSSNPYPPWRRHRSLTIHSLPSLPCR